MDKVVRSGSRGTSKRVADKEADNWTGEEYRKVMKKRKEDASDVYVSTGRGTGKVKYGDIPETSGRHSGKGKQLSTGRGTGSRKGD